MTKKQERFNELYEAYSVLFDLESKLLATKVENPHVDAFQKELTKQIGKLADELLKISEEVGDEQIEDFIREYNHSGRFI